LAYSEEVKERAYKLWAFEANRNANQVEKMLAQIEEVELGIAEPVTARTIRYWASGDGWSERANSEVYAMAPELRYLSQTTLALASNEAAAVLRESLALDPWVERTVVLKDEHGNQYAEKVREFDVNIQKSRIQAAQIIMDRTGFSPVGTRETGVVDTPPAKQVNYSLRVREIMAIDDPDERMRLINEAEAEARGGLVDAAPRARQAISKNR
jgi:hypothetical protein